jgi:hypothetical protein
LALSLPAFKVRFPEFEVDSETDTLATAKLAEAEGMVDRSLFKDPAQVNADSCVGYLAAHLLANSPGGLNARLAKEEKGGAVTLYWQPYMKLLRSAVFMKKRTT